MRVRSVPLLLPLWLLCGASASPPPEQHGDHAPVAAPVRAPAAADHATEHGEAAARTDIPPAPGGWPPATGGWMAADSFAARLAEQPVPTGPADWEGHDPRAAWAAIATSTPQNRQDRRWGLVLSLLSPLASGFAPESTGPAGDILGILDVMQADDPDLRLVGAYRLVRGIALTRLGRGDEALALLADPLLAANPEACLWRMMANEERGAHLAALRQLACSGPSLRQRSVFAARPFILSGSRAAMGAGHHGRAVRWLAQLPDRDSSANLLRGQAQLALGRRQEGRHRLERVLESGSEAEKAAAKLELIRDDLASGPSHVASAMKSLHQLTFAWRGDEVERSALILGYDSARKAARREDQLGFGATLLRYGAPGGRAPEILQASQDNLAALLSGADKMPLARAAGLFWTYRDLSPTGPQGDALLVMLADRLAGEGLYERAADLLSYQMNMRARDVEKGPVSLKVARFYILSGKPGRAVQALRASDQPFYEEGVRDARARLQAIALFQLGQADEALAMLDSTPGTAALRSEMLWRRRDWQQLVASLGSVPGKGGLSAVDQALVLRHAVALSMLGREGELKSLRARYGPAFAATPARAAFDLLTGPAENISGETISLAMASIPSVAVSAEYEPLLDARPATDRKADPAPAKSHAPQEKAAH